jgi:hypothetical protein
MWLIHEKSGSFSNLPKPVFQVFPYVFTEPLILVYMCLTLKFHVLQSVFDKVTAMSDVIRFPGDFFATSILFHFLSLDVLQLHTL